VADGLDLTFHVVDLIEGTGLMKLAPRLILAALVTGFCGGAAIAEELKIGVIAPTTGPAATVGSRQLASIKWWEREVNAAGGIKGNQVRIIHCNDEGSPDHSVTCVRDLLSQNILLLLNYSLTGAVRAAMPLVAQGPVMIIAAPGVVPPPDNFVFQTSPSDVNLTEILANFLKDNKIDRLGMIAATDASGEAATARAQEIFPKFGIALDLARIDLRANDASIQLSQIAKSGTKIIFSSYSGGSAAAVVKSYANLGLSQPLVVSYGNVSDQFLSLIKNDQPERLLGTAVRAIVPELLTDPGEKKRTLSFGESYKSFAGTRVDQLNLIALGVADTAEAILRNVANPSDAKAVREFLHTTPIKSFQTIRFSPTSHVGMSTSDLAIVELKNGDWVKADPVK
jgi:branched-chain amino acid transport system substrate-binding protein